MDEVYLSQLIQNSWRYLQNKFGGFYPADKFPILLPINTFIVVNSENSTSIGRHWIVWGHTKGEYNFADPLDLDLFSQYPNIAKILLPSTVTIRQVLKDDSRMPLQSQNSNLRGLYCVYIAHFLFSTYYPNISFITETDLLRFVKI